MRFAAVRGRNSLARRYHRNFETLLVYNSVARRHNACMHPPQTGSNIYCGACDALARFIKRHTNRSTHAGWPANGCWLTADHSLAAASFILAHAKSGGRRPPASLVAADAKSHCAQAAISQTPPALGHSALKRPIHILLIYGKKLPNKTEKENQDIIFCSWTKFFSTPRVFFDWWISTIIIIITFLKPIQFLTFEFHNWITHMWFVVLNCPSFSTLECTPQNQTGIGVMLDSWNF